MAQQTELEATPRTVLGKATKRLRKAGLIPANIYGHKEAPQAIQIDAIAFERVRRAHGARNIIVLRLPNAVTETALIRHVQHQPRSGHVLHVDFTRVSLTERVESRLPLHFVGEAPGVKLQGGVLLHLLDALTVECQARDIVEHLDVDISSLTDIDSTLHASDVRLPANYTLLTDPAEPIVKIDAPRVELPETPAAEAATEAAAPASGEAPAKTTES